MRLPALENRAPLGLIAGMNVLETLELALEVAEHLASVCRRLDIPLIFKASWDKANRTSLASYRGPGLDRGLEWLAAVKDRVGVPVLTDVHEPGQCAAVAEVAEVIQVPAFLVRQTDLLQAACGTGRAIHLKKMQLLAPADMAHAVAKCRAFGSDTVWVCERGTQFGYHHLVVDPLAFPQLKALGVPVTFDVTHALQLPGGLGHAAGGRRQHIRDLALAGVSQAIAALFLEVHPRPDEARCDGPSALPLAELEPLLKALQAVDRVVKSLG